MLSTVHKLHLGNAIIYFGPKPYVSDIDYLLFPVDKIVTLMSEREVKDDLLKAFVSSTYQWLHMPKKAFTIAWDNPDFYVVASIIAKDLEKGTNVFVHCTQGIHRTSTTVLNVMRLFGYEKKEAADLYFSIRTDIPKKYLKLI